MPIRLIRNDTKSRLERGSDETSGRLAIAVSDDELGTEPSIRRTLGYYTGAHLAAVFLRLPITVSSRSAHWTSSPGKRFFGSAKPRFRPSRLPEGSVLAVRLNTEISRYPPSQLLPRSAECGWVSLFATKSARRPSAADF